MIAVCEIHNFGDASERAYGTVAYLRFVNSESRVHCSLLLGKSRVAPLKSTTIPRRELTTATMAVKLSTMFETCLDISVDQIYYWSDSMCVLGHISNEQTRFKTFVENCLKLIREWSNVAQWDYVSNKDNPADVASRGLDIQDPVQLYQWFRGPEFL